MVGQLEGDGEKVAQMQAGVHKLFDQEGTLEILLKCLAWIEREYSLAILRSLSVTEIFNIILIRPPLTLQRLTEDLIVRSG